MIKVDHIVGVFEVTEQLLTILSTQDDLVVCNHLSHVLRHLNSLLELTFAIKVGSMSGFSLGLLHDTCLSGLSSLKPDSGLDLEGLLLGIGVSELGFLVGPGLGQDALGLSLGALLSLGLDGVSLNDLD